MPGRKGDGICRALALPAALRGAKVMGFAVKGDGICRAIPLTAECRGAKVMGFAVLYPYRQRSGAQR
uniref:Uncharacterized protein n=2 Tax=Klebsiella pneumoniae TaxID=573 RepID=A0A3G4RJ95_KLEPN|nr:hypothetical protein [Klebsiella pneumoniae]